MIDQNDVIPFGVFLERYGLLKEGLELSKRNEAGDRQRYLQRQYRRYIDHVINKTKGAFLLEPFQRPKTKLESAHYLRWERSLTARFKRGKGLYKKW